MGQGVKSLETGIALLETIVRAQKPLRLKHISELSGLSASKARMYLISLIRTGMVDQDAAGAYRPGPRAARLGRLATRADSLLSRSRDLVSALAAETASHAMLSDLDSDRLTIIFASESSGALNIAFRVGATISLSETATGQVFLAHCGEPDALLARVGERPADAALRQRLAAIRNRGLAVANQINVQDGVTLSGYGAIAVPVFGPDAAIEFVLTLLCRTTDGAAPDAMLASTMRNRALALSSPGATSL